MENNVFSKIARLEVHRLANSRYWDQLTKELILKKTNKAIETVQNLKEQIKLIARKLDHLEALLYRNYYRNLSKLPKKINEKSHSGGSDL